MKKHLLGVLLFIVFCAFGVYISPLWFQSTLIAHGSVEGTDVGTAMVPYRSSQFGMVYTRIACFKCAEKSDETMDYFNKELESAVEVIEQTPKFDVKGVKVGERAVTKFYTNIFNEYHYQVIWVENGILYEASSKSLRHVLEFEKYPDRRY